MGSYQGPAFVPRCKHGTTLYERCLTCDDEREVAHQAERARILDPAWVVEQAVRKRRRWFDGCAFCPESPALVVWSHHEPHCPFVVALGEARVAYGLHLVERFDPCSPHDSTNSAKDKGR